MNEERCLWGCVCAGLSACGVLLLWLFESRTQPMEIGSSTIEMWCSIDVSLAGATRCATGVPETQASWRRTTMAIEEVSK